MRPAGTDARIGSNTFLTLMTIVAIGAMSAVRPTNGQHHSPAPIDRRLALALQEPTAVVDANDPVEPGSRELLGNRATLEQPTDDGAQTNAQVNFKLVDWLVPLIVSRYSFSFSYKLSVPWFGIHIIDQRFCGFFSVVFFFLQSFCELEIM